MVQNARDKAVRMLGILDAFSATQQFSYVSNILWFLISIYMLMCLVRLTPEQTIQYNKFESQIETSLTLS